MSRYIPNMLSILRIICSVLLILFIKSCDIFIILYLVIGLTDILDGFIARKFSMKSELGAKLDSIADFIFYIILVIIFVNLYSPIISLNYKVLLIGIVFIRLLNLIITKLKYKQFVFVHTIANKISGVLLYFSPMIILFSQKKVIIEIILIFVFIAAVEELLITVKYQEVNLNRISLFCK